MGRIITASGLALFLVNCGGQGDGGTERPTDRRTDGQTDRAAAASDTVAARRPTVLFLGTSLTAGLGVDPEQAYPALIRRRVDSLRLGWAIVNGGLSGETSAGALRRLEWLLRGPVRLLVIETGANDGLRGLDPDSTRANIAAIVARARGYDSTMVLVLAGMEAPPNLGPAYTRRFRAVFTDLARRERLALIPFLLEGVGGVDSLNQADGIHPTPAGHRVIAATVWRTLEPLLR